MENQLGKIQNCTMTTDLWTSQHQHRSYISFTVHFIDSEFKMQSRCLQTQEVPQDHNASSLKEVLSSLFDSWKISDKVCGATTDNGRNIVNAIGLLKIEHFPCVAHTLQLSIKNGLEVTRVQRVLGRCRKLVEHFRKSTKETYKLREKQEMLKLPQHQLIQECTTRWGSTLGMLERIMEQQAAIAAVLMEGKVRHLMPDGNDWIVIELLVDILKPFQHATEVMSAVKYPTVSMVKPLLYKLVEKTLRADDSDASTAREVKKAIRNDLQERYQSAAVQRIMNIATYLDPRYKELPFLDVISKRRMIDDVQDELLGLEAEVQEASEEATSQEETNEPSPKKRKGPVSKLYRRFI